MMRKLVLGVVAGVMLIGRPAAAADGPPAIEVRVRSVDDLIGKFEYLGAITGQEEQAKQVAGLVRVLAGRKGIEGIDTKRPFGLYGTISPAVVNSTVVVMIPVADEEAFLGLLKGKLGLDPKKGDGGVYAVDVPNVPPTVYFRFAHGYAYATVQDKANVGEKAVLKPEAYFAEDDGSVASVVFHIDRLPEGIRKTTFGQFELRLSEERAKTPPGETPAQHKMKGLVLDQLAGGVKSLFTDGRRAKLRLAVDPKADELTAEFTLSANDGGELAKAIRGLGRAESLAAGATAVDNPAMAAGVWFALSDDAVRQLGPVVDDVIKEAVDNAKDADKVAAETFLAALAPTLKSGVLDAAAALTADGKFPKFVAAIKVRDGKAVERMVKEFAPFAPKDKLTVELDVARAGDAALHKATVRDDKIKAFFGTETVWLVTGPDLFAVTVEEDGAEARRAMGAKPVAAKPVVVTLSTARLAPVAEKALSREKVTALVGEVFGDGPPAGRDTMSFAVTGGEQLSVKLTVKGQALKLFAALDKAKKE